jgi:oligopeptide transport system substrate-binding protein
VRIALGLAAALVAGGCSGEEAGAKFYGASDRIGGRDEETLYANNHDEPEYIDPGLTSEAAGTTLARALFEGLIGRHPQDLRSIAAGAIRFTRSEDNRIFRFELREDAAWSDGVPVTAAHYVDAWLRVLTPATGSRMATNLYVLKNGQGFHQGRLLSLSQPTPLTPLAGGTGTELAGGTALEVLKRLPAQAAVAPLAEGALKRIDFTPSKDGAAATLGAEGATLSEGASAGEVTILAVGGKVDCNDAADRWYQVKAFGKEGWLPGCAIAEPKDASSAIVATRARPSFAVKANEVAETIGTVPLANLAVDPTLVGVRATGDRVLEVELDHPTPYFLELCSTPAFFPIRKEVIAAHGDNWTRVGKIVTNGPYLLTDHKFRYEMTFTVNPHYYDRDKMKIRRVVWLAVSDYFATLNLYKAGEIDWIGENVTLPTAFIDLLRAYGDYSQVNWISTYWYEFNTAKPPLDNPLVRRALDLALDKQQIIDKVARGGQTPARHYVPPFTGGGYAAVHEADAAAGKDPFSGPGHDYDPARARKLLAEAGYHVEERDGAFSVPDFPAIELLYNTSEGHAKIAVAVQGMWRDNLGIGVQLRNEEWAVFLKNLRDGNFQVARFGWSGDYNHPHTWLDTFLSYSNNNWTRWKSPKFDALVEQAARTSNEAESMRLYREAEKMAIDAMPRMPIYFYTKLNLIKPYMKGYWPNVDNKHGIQWMWIDPSWRDHPENSTAYPVTELAEGDLLR